VRAVCGGTLRLLWTRSVSIVWDPRYGLKVKRREMTTVGESLSYVYQNCSDLIKRRPSVQLISVLEPILCRLDPLSETREAADTL
jgi:hypothetical protein